MVMMGDGNNGEGMFRVDRDREKLMREIGGER